MGILLRLKFGVGRQKAIHEGTRHAQSKRNISRLSTRARKTGKYFDNRRSIQAKLRHGKRYGRRN